ncbi:MAG: ABC transporter permease subunit [Candidatus Eisenbacteria bacterium]|uniref:ABC transporter permease subunit n=1 Tax=Eiseniibacteriota bacterium TaxID=2212470 RepID=A0A7Y2EAU4_UNCEI|nr:ABC transporter permease subunit [Candidatus Eisenbacteria bacterium]
MLFMALAGLGAGFYLGLDPRTLVEPRTLRVLADFFGASFKPTLIAADGHSLWPAIWSGLLATASFAAAGMSLAIVFGAGLSFLATSGWWDGERAGRYHRFLGATVTAAARALIAAMRSVHELLWAMLFLAAFGLSPITGVIALAIPYGGTLAKVWSEILDEAPQDAANALRAAGGSPVQVWFLGLVPRVADDLASYGFYRFECALRSSAVLGFLGLPTLGYHVSLSFDNLLYRETWTFLYILFGLIVAVELWSSVLRKRRGWA